MATELMERIIIRHFDENGMDYRILNDRAVTVELPSDVAARGSLEALIEDRDSSAAGLFSVMAFGITRFPKSRIRRALEICNEVSRDAVGKFVVGEDDGTVSYCLDWPVAESAKPEDVGTMLSLVPEAVARCHYAFMAPRPMRDAPARARNEGAEDGGMSDDALRRLTESALTGYGDEDSRRAETARTPRIPQRRGAIRASESDLAESAGAAGTATNLLERTVIWGFDETSMPYSVPRDDAVTVKLPVEAAGTFEVAISDWEELWGEGLLNAVAPDIVKFPKSRMRAALSICNALNRRPLGKFTVDSEGAVSYRLDWIVAGSAEPKDFILMLWLIASIIGLRYPVLTAAREDGVAVEDALKRGR